MEFRIEAGRDLAACEAAVEIQREVWGEAVVVPSNLLLATVRVGGYLGLARVGEKKAAGPGGGEGPTTTPIGPSALRGSRAQASAASPSGFPSPSPGRSSVEKEAVAGFVFSFYGVRDWRFVHHSHMLAVLPPYRGSEIARALKAAQRDHCLEHGLELVTWTMDPCESRNARFNMAKLGAFAAEYHEDFYGEMPDKLNAGIASDRFLIEWPIATDRVARRLTDQDAVPSLDEAEKEVRYLLAADGDVPREPAPLGDESHYLVAAPWDFQGVKRRDPGLARRWRDAHRRSLGSALGAGYAAVEYLVGATRGAYLIVRRPPIIGARPREPRETAEATG